MPTDARTACTVFLGALLLLLALGSMAVIDRHRVQPSFQDLTDKAWIFEEEPESELTVDQALEDHRWRPATRKSLTALRRHSTLWLRVTVDAGEQGAERWLEVAPWRVGEIDLYQFDAGTGQIIRHQHIGPSLPFSAREIHSQRNLLRIEFGERAASDLLIRVQSENRSMLALRIWKGAEVQAQDTIAQLQHAVLFGCVLALVVTLILRLNLVFMAPAIWLLASFGMQAEQEGYLTFQLFSGLHQMGLAMRMTFWQIALVSFLTSALFLLDLRQRHSWRLFYWPSVLLCTTLVMSQESLDNNDLRALSTYLSMAVLLIWPFSLSRSALRGNPYRQILLVLFLFSWGESLWFTVNYAFGIRYDGLFSISAMLIRLGIIVGIIGVFTLEQQVKRKQVEQDLLESERKQKSRLKKAVAQRTRALQAAVVEANNANQAKIEFLGRVSHDLRSPLTSIIGYAQLLQTEGGAITRKAGVIFKSANHMLALVSDLIDYAKGTSAPTLLISPTYLNSVLDSVVMDAQVLAQQRNNKFSFEISGDIPPILEVDAKRLRQVLINLLDNAAKFTRDGMIGLRVRVTESSIKNESVNLHFCVHDTGQGIAQEDLPNLFAPFFRSHLQEEGSGLGLAIVEHWVNLMGGEIQVDSEVGEGTRIGFCLMLVVAAETQITDPQWLDFSIAVPPVQGQGRKVWVVEDNEDIRNLLVDELANCQFDVETAVDGEDCMTRLAALAVEPPALVLTDYLMPKLNGAQLLFALRERWPNLPVVLISATQQTLQPSMYPSPLAFDASLIKPINLVMFRQTLARLLGLDYLNEDTVADVRCDLDVVIYQMGLLDEERLHKLRSLLEQGAVTDLFEWVQGLPDEFCVLASHMYPLVEACDLDSVSALLDFVPKVNSE